MKPPSKIYLAGPMTGMPDHGFPVFNAAAKKLRDLGFDVVNPAEIGKLGDGWLACMKADIKQLLDCDLVVLLPGYESSKGAKLECDLAIGLGIRCLPLELFLAASQ